MQSILNMIQSTQSTHTELNSICLPHVLPETSKEIIQSIFEKDLNLGNIAAVDMVPRKYDGTTCSLGEHEKFLVFIHLQWNLNNPDAIRMSEQLLKGGQVKIHYMNEHFWWVRKSTSKYENEHSPSIEFCNNTFQEENHEEKVYTLDGTPIPPLRRDDISSPIMDPKTHLCQYVPKEQRINDIFYNELGRAVGWFKDKTYIPFDPLCDGPTSGWVDPASILYEYAAKEGAERRRRESTLWAIRRETSIPDTYIY